MKKATMAAAVLLILLVGSMGCVFEDSLEKILNDFSRATEKLVKDITNADKAGDSKTISRSLKDYGKSVGKIADRLQALRERHKDDKEKINIDLEKMRKDFDKVLQQFANLIIKLAKYITNGEVMDAVKGVQKEAARIMN